MNAQSKFKPIVHGLFNKRYTEQVTDRRGAVRTIKFSTGINKGERYPYASVRQTLRQLRAHHARLSL